MKLRRRSRPSEMPEASCKGSKGQRKAKEKADSPAREGRRKEKAKRQGAQSWPKPFEKEKRDLRAERAAEKGTGKETPSAQRRTTDIEARTLLTTTPAKQKFKFETFGWRIQTKTTNKSEMKARALSTQLARSALPGASGMSITCRSCRRQGCTVT